MKTAIEEMKNLFDVILIDTSAYLSEIHMSILEEADDLLLISKSDLSALRNSKLYLDTLDSMNLLGKVKLVLNKEAKKRPLEPKKIEEILGVTVDAILPEQNNVTNSIAVGQPYIIMYPRNALSKSIFLLLNNINGQESQEKNTRKQNKRRSLVKR
ncbi:CpaE family protein [Bacillus sp. N9]